MHPISRAGKRGFLKKRAILSCSVPNLSFRVFLFVHTTDREGGVRSDRVGREVGVQEKRSVLEYK